MLLDERRTRLLLRVPLFRLYRQVLPPEVVLLLALICVVGTPVVAAGPSEDTVTDEELDEGYIGVVLGVPIGESDELGAADATGSFI